MSPQTTRQSSQASRIGEVGGRLARTLVTAGIIVLLGACTAHAGTECKETTSITTPLPDPASGRQYEIYVSVPDDYSTDKKRMYPLVVLLDGGRTFAKLSCAARVMALSATANGAIIVGLSYSGGESLEDSRRRDYTPTKLKNSSKIYGGAAAYQAYVKNIVLPFVESHYRVAHDQRILWGHSYGGLFGVHILLTDPSMFQTYILGSPSFWFDNGAIRDFETRYAAAHSALAANVFLYVGGLETAHYDPARRGNTQDMVKGMMEFEKRLRAHKYGGLHVKSTVIAGKDHRSSVTPGFNWGLGMALGGPRR